MAVAYLYLDGDLLVGDWRDQSGGSSNLWDTVNDWGTHSDWMGVGESSTSSYRGSLSMPISNIDTVTSVDIEAYIKNAIDDLCDLQFILQDSTNTNVGAVSFNSLTEGETTFNLHTATVGSLTGAMDQARWDGMRLLFDPNTGNGAGSPRLQVSGVRVKITYTEVADPDVLICGVVSLFGSGASDAAGNGGTLMGRDIKKGSADQSTILYAFDSTTGLPKTGMTYATSGLALWSRREGGSKTSITAVSLTNLNDSHTDHGFKEIGDGYYRLDGADTAFATGANGVMFGGTVTGGVIIGNYHALVDFDPQDSVRLGLTAMPNAAAAASGGLIINGQNALGAGAIQHITIGPVRYGSTSRILEVFIPDTRYPDNRGRTGLVYGDVTAYYIRADQGNAGGTSISVVTATRGGYSSGGFVEKDSTNAKGWYQFGSVTGMFATGAKEVCLVLTGAAFGEVHIHIPIVYNDIDSATTPVNLIAVKGTLLGTESAGAGAIANAMTKQYNVSSGGNFTNESYNQTGDNYAQVTHVDHGLAALKTLIDGISGGGGGPSVGDIVDGILEELLAGRVTAGSVGKALNDINTNAASAASNAATAASNAADAETAANNAATAAGNAETAADSAASAAATAASNAADAETAAGSAATAAGAAKLVTDKLDTMLVPDGGDWKYSPESHADVPTGLSTEDAEKLEEIRAGVLDPMPELTEDPGATPTLQEAQMRQYMEARNKRETTSTTDTIHNDAGTAISSQTLNDDGTKLVRGKAT